MVGILRMFPFRHWPPNLLLFLQVPPHPPAVRIMPALMVADVYPQVAVPMHGGDSQHRRFKELVDAKRTDVRVVIAVPFEGHKVSLQ